MMGDLDRITDEQIRNDWAKYGDLLIRTDMNRFNRIFNNFVSPHDHPVVFKLKDLIISQTPIGPDHRIHTSYNLSDTKMNELTTTCRATGLHYKVAEKYNNIEVYMPTNWNWSKTPANPSRNQLTILKHNAHSDSQTFKGAILLLSIVLALIGYGVVCCIFKVGDLDKKVNTTTTYVVSADVISADLSSLESYFNKRLDNITKEFTDRLVASNLHHNKLDQPWLSNKTLSVIERESTPTVTIIFTTFFSSIIILYLIDGIRYDIRRILLKLNI